MTLLKKIFSSFFSDDIPFKLANAPIYYGWVIVFMGVIGVLMSIPGQTAGFAPFTEPLLLATKITRKQLSLCYLIGTITSGFLLPRLGNVLDEKGPRMMIVFTSISFGFVLLFLSYLPQIITFMQGFFSLLPLPVMYMVGLTVGIFGIRFFGQGLLPVISNTMVGKWFAKRRGRAFALMSVFTSLAFANAPVVMNSFVNELGWQMSWRYLALIVGPCMAVCGWVFFRNNPESCHLVVDGIQKKEKLNQQTVIPEENSFTLHKAIRTIPFWAITLVLGTTALVSTGLFFHIAAIGKEAGLSETKALGIFIPITLISLPLGLLCSFFSDWIRLKYIIVLMALGQFLAYISFLFFANSIGYILVVLGLGISGGCFGPILTIGLPYYFGRKHLGSINSKITSFIVIGSAIGPYYFSLVFAEKGSFALPIVICAILPLISLIMSIKIKNSGSGENIA